jgi:hypothetical protein
LPLALLLAGRGVQAPLPEGTLPTATGRKLSLVVTGAILLVLLASLVLRWPLWATAFQGLRLPPL